MASASSFLRRRSVAGSIAAVTLAAGLLTATEASAWYDRWGRWHGGPGVGGAVAAGVIGGLALGALAAGAARPVPPPPPVYVAPPPTPVYVAPPAPVYVEPVCGYQPRRVWDGYGWTVAQVRVCH